MKLLKCIVFISLVSSLKANENFEKIENYSEMKDEHLIPLEKYKENKGKLSEGSGEESLKDGRDDDLLENGSGDNSSGNGSGDDSLENGSGLRSGDDYSKNGMGDDSLEVKSREDSLDDRNVEKKETNEELEQANSTSEWIIFVSFVGVTALGFLLYLHKKSSTDKCETLGFKYTF